MPAPRWVMAGMVGAVLLTAGLASGGELRSRGADLHASVAVPDADTLLELQVLPRRSVARTVVRATVICSDARPIRVPIRDIGSAEPGEAVVLGIGTCVVHWRPEGGSPGGAAPVVR